jgi:zinc D-Ala-D-Ala carboxypeptidase
MSPLSKNFSIEEFCVSQTAARMGRLIEPDKKQENYIRLLVTNVLQPLRDLLGSPVVITSGYRPPWLNAMIGGSENSQHMKGQAADFVAPGVSIGSLIVAAQELPFDQLINEFDQWVHVSYIPGLTSRQEILHARSSDGTTVYSRLNA